MIAAAAAPARQLRLVTHEADLVVVGGGLAGVCAALAAARSGLRVVLVQDRPVLGGNSSSEVRLWVLGATAHQSNNNRWAREGWIVEELLVENLRRNPEGNALFWDTLLLEKALAEPSLTVLLNTAVDAVDKAGGDRLAAVHGFCSQNATRYCLRAPLFCDASGDGIVGYLAGAAFRMGAEPRAEFGEAFAPDETYGQLLGHTIVFYSKDTGRPVAFTPPAFAMADITQVPRWREFDARQAGSRLWWIEWGGRLDTVHDTEAIKWELWKIVYGVWNHVKNSGRFPEAANLTLEWVGTIPGKRESRRFEGDYWLRQQDIVGQTDHPDVVAHGGWSIDLHPADGIYSSAKGCDQWHARGVFGLPYRMLYSRTVPNLFLAGRILSATHVAFGACRVMGTVACAAQAVGLAAALCHRQRELPHQLNRPERRLELQRALQRRGQHLPRLRLADPSDLVGRATVAASSEWRLAALPPDGPRLPLAQSRALLLPVSAGPLPELSLVVDVRAPTTLRLQWRTSDHPENHSPDVVLASCDRPLAPGVAQSVGLPAGAVDVDRYVFACALANPDVDLVATRQRVTGLLGLRHERTQMPPGDIGVERLEFWTPERRPAGQLPACRVNPPVARWAPSGVLDPKTRPTNGPNAWVADPGDPAPALTLRWPRPETIARVDLFFDTDADHAAETVLWGHPERAMPACVARYRVFAGNGALLAEAADNHAAWAVHRLPAPVFTDSLRIELGPTHGGWPPALMRVAVYPPADGL